MTKFGQTLTAVLVGATVASAQESEERTEESFIPRYAVASSYFSWGGETNFSNTSGSVSMWEAGAEANVPVYKKDGFLMTAGAKYRRNNLEFSGAPFPLDSKSYDLTRVDIPINAWIELNDRWKLWGRVQPGWYSDFGNVGSDDFILTSLALLSYKLNDSMKVAFGAFYSRDLGEERLLPAFGFIYEPNQQWSLALTFPRVEVAYAPDRNSLLTARAVLSGAGWNIEDPAGGDQNVDLNYKSIRVSLGYDQRIGTSPWWAYVDGGMQVGQEIEIEGGGYEFSEDLDSNVFVNAGVKLRF
ncbi:DUF6268 family outer membrane beta-barrel protein [Verrucomicrobiales bacterium]|nr:DUF6268 family outer membrane beta-barrel protein [Verrucomicrobiales bacterium]MDB4617519.1 DUF6268 family outer membrane beta-barrel protein [Verrucomicrobiales bacterium]